MSLSAGPSTDKCVRKTDLQKGFQTLLEFRSYTTHRFGNALRTWFHLDPDANMRLGEKQFARGCVEIGFRGNVSALWRYLDSDTTGTISLLELDSAAAMALSGLKHIVIDCFEKKEGVGLPAEKAYRWIDSNHSGRVPKSEFVLQLKRLGYPGSAAKLFDLLDFHAVGVLSIRDMQWLDKWNPPPYIFATADDKGLQIWKERLLDLHQSLLKAWRKVLGRDGTMRLSWDEFCNANAEISRTPPALPAAFPRSRDELAAVWRAIDQDCGGWISLREFDQESFDIVGEFKRWAVRVHGGVVKAFRQLDSASGNCRISESELKKAARGKDGCNLKSEQFELLFDGLCPQQQATQSWALTENDVKFLDSWDIAWEDWEASAKRLPGRA